MLSCPKWTLGLLVILFVAVIFCGCDSTPPTANVGPMIGHPLAANSRLSERDLSQFLDVVAELPAGRVPEFTPDDAPDLDLMLSADELIAGFQKRFQGLFDPKRQGRVWHEQGEVRRPVEKAGLTTTEFAALVRNISCAIMVNQLGVNLNIDELGRHCSREIEALSARMNEVDRQGKKLDEVATRDRTRAAIRLGRMVALREFVITLQTVPAENVELVRDRMSELVPLIPARRGADPFAEDFLAPDLADQPF